MNQVRFTNLVSLVLGYQGRIDPLGVLGIFLGTHHRLSNSCLNLEAGEPSEQPVDILRHRSLKLLAEVIDQRIELFSLKPFTLNNLEVPCQLFWNSPASTYEDYALDNTKILVELVDNVQNTSNTLLILENSFRICEYVEVLLVLRIILVDLD